jgi:hypothetical protein
LVETLQLLCGNLRIAKRLAIQTLRPRSNPCLVW